MTVELYQAPPMIKGRAKTFGTRQRVAVDGKFFQLDGQRWYLKGLTYGPFAMNSEGEHLPEESQIHEDLAQMRTFGANALRVYHVPSMSFMDLAHEQGFKVFVDIPWEKHRCFFEDWTAQRDAVASALRTARRLGNHPALFALSVVNEIPVQVARFYGHRRVEGFIEKLIDAVKQVAPSCPVTFANYPTTEFLQPRFVDFHCFNVYLENDESLGRYLDRLQHIAGNQPLILGEFGVDSIRKGQEAQAERIASHIRSVYRHGLAGSFVFSYTDEWYTGGHDIEDWAFGITTRERTVKPAAAALSSAWATVPRVDQTPEPSVSVVVCSYNGATTLDECLASLMRLTYPDYEVILVDDGSRDNTPEIAARYPKVRYHHQENRGLSVARNVGATLARGKIVAYTDSDCMADPDWLTHLVSAMQRQNVHAIGGPNIPPPSDSRLAQCVALSPGGPSHVMFDDQHAEHIPGCNMAFYRDELLSAGGFDPRYRQAGDDVDICWRYLDRGWKIGFAPAAVVWHKRRNTVSAYLKQQKGYGRSETLLRLKHPHRVGGLGALRWRGVIYGEGAVGLPVTAPIIYHGRQGEALFQTRHRSMCYSMWAYFSLLEWQAAAALMLLLGLITPLAALAGLVMFAASIASAIRIGWAAPQNRGSPWWTRPLVCVLTYLQPLVRGWHRTISWAQAVGNPAARVAALPAAQARAFRNGLDMFWDNHANLGREELLSAVELECRQRKWPANSNLVCHAADLELAGDFWHVVEIRTASEELGWPRRFTRCRLKVQPTSATWMAGGALAFSTLVAVLGNFWTVPLILLIAAAFYRMLRVSRRHCLDAAARLVAHASGAAGLAPSPVQSADRRNDDDSNTQVAA